MDSIAFLTGYERRRLLNAAGCRIARRHKDSNLGLAD
jgi:hypothetical protein